MRNLGATWASHSDPGKTMLPSPSQLRPQTELPFAPRPELRLVPRTNRVAVLLNANAKRVNEGVRRSMGELVPSGDLFYCHTLEEAEAHVHTILDQRYGTVLMGGGDGTIATTINLLVKQAERMGRGDFRHALPDLGILRLGTGNGLANMTGAGRPSDDVARLLAGERPRAHVLRLIEDVDSGWVYPFASLGYDAQVLNDYVDAVKDSKTAFGRALMKSLPGYFWAIGTRTIPAELRAERARVRVVAQGRASILDPETAEEIPLEAGATLFEGSARAVAMGTSPFYGYGLKALPHALRRTDRFHIRVSAASIGFLLSHLPSLWKGTLKSPDFVDFLVEGADVESTVPLPMQMAGDARGHTNKVSVRLHERCFRLLEGTGKVLE